MVDFWKSWRGEYNDAALQTEKKGQKTTLTWKQRSKTSRSALSEGLNTSLPSLRYPIICSDSHRWKSPDDFSHGLLISEFKHH